MWLNLRAHLNTRLGLEAADGTVGPHVPAPSKVRESRHARPAPQQSLVPTPEPAPSPPARTDAAPRLTPQQLSVKVDKLIASGQVAQARLLVHTAQDFQVFCRRLAAHGTLGEQELKHLSAARHQVLAHSEHADYDRDYTLSILNDTVQRHGSQAARRGYDSITGEIDPGLTTSHLYADQECHGHPERYAHNLAVTYQAKHGHAPRSVDELVVAMKEHLPPLKSTVHMGPNPDHSFRATAGGYGFCDNLAEYVLKTFQCAGDSLGFRGEVDRRVAKVACAIDDAGSHEEVDKHFSVAIGPADPHHQNTSASPHAQVIDLWMGRNGIAPSWEMKGWILLKDGSGPSHRPETFGSRADWERACRHFWGEGARFN